MDQTNQTTQINQTNHSIYSLIGGEYAVRQIVESFYPKVQQHPLLGPLFPQDIRGVMEKQILFLTQFFGGHSLYTEQYGHPMMRARHMPFPITPERADAWLSCMRSALSELNLQEELEAVIMDRLTGTAHHFINKN